MAVRILTTVLTDDITTTAAMTPQKARVTGSLSAPQIEHLYWALSIALATPPLEDLGTASLVVAIPRVGGVIHALGAGRTLPHHRVEGEVWAADSLHLPA